MATRAFALLLVCVLALAACGGDGGDGGGDRDAEALIEEAVVTFAKSRDPADCRRLATPRLLKQLRKSNYEVSLATCEELTADPRVEAPEKAIVSQVEVEGDTATATVFFLGSILHGQTVRYALVERDGQWKHDELLAFLNFDAESLAMEMGRQMLLWAASPQEAEGAICVMERLRRLSDENLEAIYLDEDPDPMLELSRSCASRSDPL